MNACIGEPISWLRLERYQLNELAQSERERVTQHLTACELCSACLAHARTPVQLPPLPSARPAARELRHAAPRWRMALALATAALAVASGVLVLRPADITHEPGRPSRLRIKGGELAFDLVREHLGSIAHDSSHFAEGDRFKLLLTCPPQLRPLVDVVVFQGDGVFFPLQATRLEQCGNQVALPGAFALDGSASASVCVLLSETTPTDRRALERGGSAALPALSLCQSLRAVAAKPFPL